MVLLLVGIILMLLCAPITAMDLGDGTKSLIGKLPPFSGKKDDFIMWLAKFTALATMGAFAVSIARNTDGSFGEANCPKTEAEFNTLDATKADEKLKIDAWKRNSKAFAALTLSLPNKLFRIIAASNGLAAEVMRLLYQEYKPDDNISWVEAERKYAAIRLSNNGDPRYLSQRFAEIAHQHPHAAADNAKKVGIILSASPMIYQSVITSQLIQDGETYWSVFPTPCWGPRRTWRHHHGPQDVSIIRR
jgi:hypothetical protein